MSAKVHGWHFGFGLAGIGMLFGLLVFLMANNYWMEGWPQTLPTQEIAFAGINKGYAIYLAGIALVGISWVLIQYRAWS